MINHRQDHVWSVRHLEEGFTTKMHECAICYIDYMLLICSIITKVTEKFGVVNKHYSLWMVIWEGLFLSCCERCLVCIKAHINAHQGNLHLIIAFASLIIAHGSLHTNEFRNSPLTPEKIRLIKQDNEVLGMSRSLGFSIFYNRYLWRHNICMYLGYNVMWL